MGEGEAKRYWVRTEQGRVWGPFPADQLTRLKGQITDKAEASFDGHSFRPVGDFPELQPFVAHRNDAHLRERAGAAPYMGPALRSMFQMPAQGPVSMPIQAQVPVPPKVPVQALVAEAQSDAGRRGPPVLKRQAVPEVPEETGVPRSGDLSVTSPVRLYALAAQTSANGALELRREDRHRITVSFRRGTPAHLSSDDPRLSLLGFLEAKKLLAPQQLAPVREQVTKHGADPLSVLLQRQLVPSADAHRLLREHALFLLDRALESFRGTFSFQVDAPAADGAFPLGQKWTLLAEAVRRLDATAIRNRLGGRLSHPVVRSGGLAIGKVEELALNAQETRLYGSIDGTRTGEELLKQGDASATLRLLYLLIELKQLSVGEGADEPAAAPIVPPTAFANTAVIPPPSPPDVFAARPTPVLLKPVAAQAPSTPASPSLKPVAAQPPSHPTSPSLKPVSPQPASKPTSPSLKPVSPQPSSTPTSPSLKPVGPQPASKPTSPSLKPVASPAGSVRPTPTSMKPATPPQAVKAVASFAVGPANETPAAQLARLRALLEKLEKATHFEALGLDRKASVADVKRSFVLLARDFHPDTVTDPSQSELRGIKERLFARVNNAAQVLGDDTRRKEYEKELEGEKKDVDVGRIFDAEDKFHRAEILIKARKYKEGLQILDEAIVLNPTEAEFYAWRGYARFLLAQDRKAAFEECAADVRKAIKMLERCVPAYLFLGQMQKVVGDSKGAQASFQKVLQLDDRNLEAQRELRMFSKR